MNKLEAKPGALEGSLEQCGFSLDQLLSQEKHQNNFASYLAGVNKRRSELEFDELTGNEIGVKLAFAFKANQPELRRLALDYLEARGKLLDQLDQDKISKFLPLDMAACDLSKTDLWGANLKGVDLRQADLRQADLTRADLARADLENVNLSEVNLSKANLRRAYLWGANLREAYLLEANFSKANFQGADLRGVCYLDYITAFEANFRRAKLGQAEIEGLNRLDQKERNLLLGASGLIRNESDKIIGVAGIESLPDSKPETEEIGEAQDIGDNLANLISAIIALPAEEQEALIKGLKDLEIHPTNEQTRS